MSQNLQSIADWMIFHKPLYMGRIVRTHTRGGVNFIVEEANENQHRKWFAFNFVDESGKFEGIDKFTHRVLVGRHKLLTKNNQLKYAEDFYASLNNHKVKELLGPEFSSLGGQWIQINGVDDISTSYAWLVLSPWGKVWMSRLAILCLAVATTDNFTTSDMVDQSAISLKDLPQPMQILASSNLHTNRQGDSTIKDNHTIVSLYNPARKFKSDSADILTQNTFGHLYGLEQYAAVRGDSLWDPEKIGQTLGRTAITGIATFMMGGGVWGFAASGLNQEWERHQYLTAAIPGKVKQQSDDLYESALVIIEIAKKTNDANTIFAANKLREAVDDFRKTMPTLFEGGTKNTKSFYNGTPEEIRKRYRGVFAQTKNTEPNKQTSTTGQPLGISEPEDKSLMSKLDTDRLPESAALGLKTWLTQPGKWNPNKWGALAAPIIAPHIERAIAIHNLSGPGAAIKNQSDNMREILGEIRVLAREFDHKNTGQNMYQEVEMATNVINSFLVKIMKSLPKQNQIEKLSPNYKEIPGVSDSVYH